MGKGLETNKALTTLDLSSEFVCVYLYGVWVGRGAGRGRAGAWREQGINGLMNQGIICEAERGRKSAIGWLLCEEEHRRVGVEAYEERGGMYVHLCYVREVVY